ncbi:MAG: hypothetical protein ACOYN5_10045 [Bacteroidales bacterium]
MKKKQDYIKDIADIRTMMERSSKFLSLSGWAGILAGIYALVGAYIAHSIFRFNPTYLTEIASEDSSENIQNIVILAISILIFSVGTALILSLKRATKRSESVWNATSRRMLINMAVPLVSGGILILILLFSGFISLLIPLTLLFYGLALFNAANYTYREVRFLGLILTILGLMSACFVEFSLLFWAGGFGLMHIVYGLFIHLKYER